MSSDGAGAGVVQRYQALVDAGTIGDDAAQRVVASQLDRLAGLLTAPPPRQGFFNGLFGRKPEAPAARGLYIFGSVGRGKSMLMDLFVATLEIQKKRRVHFHDFMQDVHKRVHAHRQMLASGQTKQGDPIPPVADALARDARVLCFDEFAITDIADAMILGRLFEALFTRGVIVVATSNVHPSNLYRDGLKRDNILPFIALLEARMDIVELRARTDFRMEKLGRAPVWMVPLSPETRQAMDQAWARVAGPGEGVPISLPVLGRTLEIARSGMGAARFSFRELVEKPLGAADFLAIAEAFHTVLIDDIEPIPALERNVAKRFITLIDALYDHRVKLVASSSVGAEALYPDGTGREGFEMERAISRLIEMRADSYLALPHLTRTDDHFVAVET